MNHRAGLSTDFHTGPRARRRSLLRGKRVLFVDDDLLMRLAMTRLLRDVGAVCLGTGTHDQAVMQVAFEPMVDLAILDFEMPDGDVGRLVRRLHWQRPALPLVGTSGSDRRSDFAERGVVRFLAKPFGLDDLIRVADWCDVPGKPASVAVPCDSANAVPQLDLDRINSFAK